jgi:hypothetical protein
VGLDRDRNPSRAGLQPANVEKLLACGATTVVLSRGMDQQLHVDPATMNYPD